MTEELYERPDIYDIVYKKENSESLEKHYANVLGDKNIETVHDCSIRNGQFDVCTKRSWLQGIRFRFESRNA